MSIVNLFVSGRPQIGNIYFDAILTESSELRTDVSEYPLETGITANDNAVTRPLILTMTVGASDNLIKSAIAEAGSMQGLLSAGASITAGTAASMLSGGVAALAGLGITVGTQAIVSASGTKRSMTILEKIRDLQRENTILTVVGVRGTYKNMIIVNTRQETNKENEGGLELVVEMRQLNIIDRQGDASTQNANLPVNDTATTQGQATINLGQVQSQ